MPPMPTPAADRVRRFADPLRLVLPVALALALAGCGGTGDRTATPAPTGAVTSGPDDGSAPAGDQDGAGTGTGTSDNGAGSAVPSSDAGATTTTGAPASTGASADPGAGADPDAGPHEPVPTVAELAAELGAETVVVDGTDGATVVVWHRGRTVEVATGGQGAFVDRQYLYRFVDDPDGGLGTVASTFDGAEVCRVSGIIHHLTSQPDGALVAAIEGELPEPDPGGGEQPVPLFAVDCRTGERRPIEPVTFHGADGEFRFVQRVADRVFTGRGDAEGNADIRNEDGIPVNGDDYAGYHTFSGDGALVVYGDMAESPHLSTVLVARDTRTGEQRWRVELELPFRGIHLVGDRVIVGVNRDLDAALAFDEVIDRVLVLDGATGQLLAEVPVGLPLLFIG